MKAETMGGELRMLLAVVAVAAGPVVGAAMGAHASAPPPPAAPIILVQPMVVQMAAPRTLPSGAPACGNVVTRAIPQEMP